MAGPATGPLGILGGAFDPVHVGHLRLALEVAEQLELEEVRLVPSANPPHRDPHVASGEQRIAMLEAAVADTPAVTVDDREIRRAGTSWTVLTLEELRAEFPDRSLCLLVGEDAFLGLPDWHRAAEILELAHVAVARRPGWELPAAGPVAELLARYEVVGRERIHEQRSGCISVCEITQLEIASSVIRKRISSGTSIRYLTPGPVVEMIATSGCYAAGPKE
jgi:nicotinate-nucleotide adenylyltransferase